MLAVGLAAAHRIARDVAAAAAAVGIHEAAARHGQQRVIALCNGVELLADRADMLCGCKAELAGILGDGQRTDEVITLDANNQDFVLCVDGKHLLVHGRADARAVVV